MRPNRSLLYQIALLILFTSCSDKKSDNGPIVRVENNEANKSVNIYFGDDLFTSYIYPAHLMKPCLWPVFNSKGTEITRKYPMEKAPGERSDHPHQVGIWMNYGDVNGIDYWGHSEATPADDKHRYGTIRHQEVVNAKSAKGEGTLTVINHWVGGGRTQIKEEITYHFIDRGNIRIIDRIGTLTAQEDILFKDNKEGMFAIRVSRELELPSDEAVTLTDSYGNPVEKRAINNELVSGDYLSSEGITGADVWGTRAKWMMLFGMYQDEKVAVVIIDHINNPGYPAYWHARGYGLFSVNPLGQNVFSEGNEALNLNLKDGDSTRFAFRTLICSGDISDDEINNYMTEFSDKY